jgi:acyl transferase domain-containing protein/NADP-dependent 3-hydroxy acid dehydrogenase YdfG
MASGTAASASAIAVVGVGALMPDSRTVGDFWRHIMAARDLLTDVPASRWRIEDYYDADPAAPDRTYGRRGAFLPEIDFDPLRYGIPPKALSAIDTSQLLALMVAEQVLTDCAVGLPADRERVSVLLGASPLQLMLEVSSRLQRPVWLKALRERGMAEDEAQAACDAIAANFVPWQEETFPGLLTNVISGRIANRFDLHGTNHTTDAACASSLAAVYTAVAELTLGRADLVITGGVDTMNDITMYTCFSRTPALSPTGDCRPFADGADGTMLGEGIAMFALKRLADAERDGDRVYAVIRGIGSSSDGRGSAIYAPIPEGQARALRRAYADAGYGPETVELVEAHGTGTRAGDAAEFAALRQVFGATGRTDRQWCALGSVKSQIGHTKAAAGAAGLLKAVLALHQKVLPPTIKVDEPSADLALDASPFYLSSKARPWTRSADHPRRASVSSFGFGGTNFHVTLEEYRRSAGSRARPAFRLPAAADLVLLSAASPGELLSRARQLDLDGSVSEVARAARQSFWPGDDARLAVVADSGPDFAAKLAAAAPLIESGEMFSAATGVHFGVGEAVAGRVAFLFPGQGSQYVDMGSDLAMHMPQAQAVWDRAAGLDLGDTPLHRVVFPPPACTDSGRLDQEARLTATEWAQPALAVHSAALLSVLAELKLVPDCVAGHSFGELTALHAAGAYDAGTLFRLARKRGELMRDASNGQGAIGQGAMLAVTAAKEQVEAISGRHPDVWLANHNGPAQVVLAGTRDALEVVCDRLSSSGIRTTWLNASAAFHSPLVAAAAEPFLEFLREQDVRGPAKEVYGGADAQVYPDDGDELRRRLAAQLTAPVRFLDTIEAMYASGVRTFVEVGPGAVLTGLTGQILGDREHVVTSLDRKGQPGFTALLNGLGRLAVRGVALDYAVLGEPAGAPGGKPAGEQPRMTVKIDGGNYGRPYPPRGGATAPAGAPAGAPEPAREGATAGPADADHQRSHHANHRAEHPRSHQAEHPRSHQAEHPQSHQVAVAARADDEPAVCVLDPAPSLPAVSQPVAAQQVVPHPALSQPVAWQPAATQPPEYRPASEQTAVVPAAAPVPARADDGWRQVVEAAQRQTAEAHAAFQKALTDSHMTYLRMAEATFAGLLGQATGMTAAPLPSPALPSAPLSEPPPGLPEPFAALPQPVTTPEPLPAPPVIPSAAPLTSSAAPVTSSAAPLLPPATPPDGPGALLVRPKLDADSVGAMLLSVVAERTGYPVEMLNIDMDLEADLGIDSIKKVEILSTIREQVGDMPGVDLKAFASLRTLRAIAEKTCGPDAAIATPAMTEPAMTEPAMTEPAISVAAPPAAAEPEPDLVPLSRFIARAVITPPSGLTMLGLTDGPVAVTDDGTGVAPALADILVSNGIQAQVVTDVPADARGVVILDGLRHVASVDDAVAVNQAAFRVARQVAKGVEPAGGVFVTVQDTGGSFGLAGSARLSGGVRGGRPPRSQQSSARAWLGGLGALARTAEHEWPRATVKAIDCERAGRTPDSVAAAIAAELLAGGPATAVGLRADGSRVTVTLDSVPVHHGRPVIDENSVIVATGGARGITAVALRALARECRPSLVLLGATPLTAEPGYLSGATDEASLIRQLARRQPGSPAEIAAAARGVLAVREIRESLADMERLGARVRYLAVDVRDGAALSAALAEVRGSWGPITGVVHGAGVLADSLIADKTDDQFTRVFSTKVQGLRAVLGATADDPLDTVCVFSSIAAYTGNVGQSDYAMANEVLNQVLSAEQARRPGCLVRAIGWGPWQGGMVTEAIAERFRRRGVPLIDPRAGASAFLAELGAADGDARVVLCAGGDDGLMTRARDGIAAQVTVAEPAYAHLADHQVAGVPVVPVATVLDWFVGAARAWRPQACPIVLRDLRVLNKIALPKLAAGGHRLVLRGHEATARDGLALDLDLRGDSDLPHYRASAVAGQPSAGPAWAEPGDLAAPERVYDGATLFHGPRFQAIRSAGISAAGAAGDVAGSRALGWAGSSSGVDQAAVDGGLQLAVLWAQRAGAGRTLPMAVRECRVSQPGDIPGSVRCVVLAGRAGDSGAECDVALLDADGRARVELLGVHLVRRPD